MVHIASWEVVISESNETRGLHAYELWQPRVLPSWVVTPSQHFGGGAWCIAIACALIKTIT